MSGGDWVDLTEAITGLVERNGWAPAPVIEVPAKSDVRERSEEPQAPAIDGLAIPYRTPLEVATTTPGRTAWIVRGYAALQGITEVDGKVKSAGKTTFLLALTGAALDGSPFLGQPVTACKVVYVTEQAPGPFREALERAGLMGRGDELRIVFRRDVAHIPWRELVATITADAIRDGYAVVIWDTIAKLAGIREENDAGQTAQAMVPLQDSAHDGLCVIVARHDRKSGGDVGESGRGSSAISGDVDVILQLRPPQGNQPSTRRVIESLSRYSETPETAVIELTDEGYVLLGDEEAVSLADALRIVSALLRGGMGGNEKGWSLDELVEESELPRTNVQRALREFDRRRELVTSGKGVRGNPKRYAIQEEETDSALTSVLEGGIESESESGQAA